MIMTAIIQNVDEAMYERVLRALREAGAEVFEVHLQTAEQNAEHPPSATFPEPSTDGPDPATA